MYATPASRGVAVVCRRYQSGVWRSEHSSAPAAFRHRRRTFCGPTANWVSVICISRSDNVVCCACQHVAGWCCGPLRAGFAGHAGLCPFSGWTRGGHRFAVITDMGMRVYLRNVLQARVAFSIWSVCVQRVFGGLTEWNVFP